MLTRIASELPGGLDTMVEFGVCDGSSLQLLDDVDVDFYTEITSEGGRAVSVAFVSIRAHHHPGEGKTGQLLRGVAAEVDEELHRLTGSGYEGEPGSQ